MTAGNENSAILTDCGWLSHMPREFQQAVLGIAVWRHFRTGDQLAFAGDDRVSGMFGIANGCAAISAGAGEPIIALVHPGGWTGIGPMIASTPRFLTIQARTDLVAALIPAAAMHRLLHDRPEWWRYLGVMLLENDRLAYRAITDLMLRDSRTRCLAMLLHASGCRLDAPPDDRPITVPLSQDEFATMANLSRQTMRAIVAPLAARGLVTFGYRSIIVHDVAAVQQLFVGCGD
jgi:CRP/FNR family transcriptional regulator, cyclic AMP receptor protein